MINELREESVCMRFDLSGKKSYLVVIVLFYVLESRILLLSIFLGISLYVKLIVIVFSLLLKDICQNQFCLHKIYLPEPS